MFNYSGIGDEAASDLAGQIKATKALHWHSIEPRFIDGKCIHDLDEAAFEKAAAMLKSADITVNCISSTVANWSYDPFKDEDFEKSKQALQRALDRMEVLNCKMIRGMSFLMQKQLPPNDRSVEAQVFPKLRQLVNMCAERGMIYAHENCANYGGQSPEHSLRLVEEMHSDYFKLLFDTGNPVQTDYRVGEPPFKRQNSWDFYQKVKPFLVHVHIKDGIFLHEQPAEIFPAVNYTYPGEGDGDVKRILADLLKSNYNGYLSIEPHLAVVFHESDHKNSKEEFKYQTYCEYGKRLMALVDEAKKELA